MNVADFLRNETEKTAQRSSIGMYPTHPLSIHPIWFIRSMHKCNLIHVFCLFVQSGIRKVLSSCLPMLIPGNLKVPLLWLQSLLIENCLIDPTGLFCLILGLLALWKASTHIETAKITLRKCVPIVSYKEYCYGSGRTEHNRIS